MNSKKVLADSNYIFSPTNRTIKFVNGYQPKQEDILLIVNLNGNILIYNFACATEGGTFANNTLTLTYNTTTMSASDKLMVVVVDKDTSNDYLDKILQELKQQNDCITPLYNGDSVVIERILDGLKAVRTPVPTITDFGLRVQLGLVPNVTFNNKFGRNTATVTGDAIWAASTAYTEPASAEVCNVVSSSVQDLSGGTGASQIIITGLNESYDVVTEYVTLNGTTDVVTKNKYWNIHRAYVSKAVSDSGAVGNISITTTAVGTPVIGYIAIGYNQTQSTVYMVPRGHTAYINVPEITLQTTTANLTMGIGLFKKNAGGVFRIQNDFLLTGGNENLQIKWFGAPLIFEEKSTVLFKCIAASASADVSVDYDIWLVKNNTITT